MTESDPDVYRRLQQHLDSFPIGYPATESGVEIRILKHLFTPEEAEIATKMHFQPQPLDKIYRRVKKSGITIEELEKALDKMGKKGSIMFGSQEVGGKKVKYYANAFFAVGMYEFQLNHLTLEFIEDCMQYMK